MWPASVVCPQCESLSLVSALVAAIGALSPDRTDALEAAWREAVTSIIVPMLQGAAVHTAMVAEQIAIDMPSP